jgi:hypothetical protein
MQYGNNFKLPSGVAASDKTGEHGSAKNNIPNAKTNDTGSDKKMNGGRKSGIVYTHKRAC